MQASTHLKQLELLYKHLPVSILTGYAGFGFIIFILWEYVELASFITWIIAFNFIMVYRYMIYVLYKQRYRFNLSAQFLHHLNFISTILTGSIWATLTLYYEVSWPLEVQISLWVLLFALMSGASASFSVIFSYYLAYVLPIFLMSVSMQFVTDNYTMMILFFFYMIFLTLTAMNFHRGQNTIIIQQEDLLEANQQLKALANMDTLTNLPNRRAFDDYFTEEWARHVRSKNTLSLMMIDVDFFKNYNDHYGHDKGDECLKEISIAIRQSLLRPTDKAARYGGEEFIILLPDTHGEGAKEVAERLHKNLRHRNIQHEYSKVSKLLTVSIGIATMTPKPGEDPKILQLMADRELYKAKASGRNCTSINEE